MKKIKATICFLVKDSRVLLGMKKRGFGAGMWNGMGGKIAEGETVKKAAIRETYEEIDVTPLDLKKAAVFNFYWPDWEQKVTVFLVKKWEGTPKESEEMKPRWFPINKLPLKKMWVDDYLWLPKILRGEKLKGEFVFDQDQNLLKQVIKRF